MPLPILQVHTDPTPEDLVRLFHRTELHWVRHLGEEAQLDAGVAFTNPQLPDVRDANMVIDAALAPGVSPADAVEEVRQHFRGADATCRQWILNPSAAETQARPLSDHLTSSGWMPRPYDIMHLGGRTMGTVAAVQGLTIIPARASFRHARDLAEEVAAAHGVPQWADASMLHLDDSHWDILIALRDGKAVARAGVLAVGDIGRIEDVFVSEPFRRQGIGRTMMGRMLEICARSLFKHVMLCVPPQERGAIDLYTRLGFRRIGQLVSYQAPGGGVDASGHP